MKTIGMILIPLVLMGCTRLAQPVTPDEQEEQAVRMKNILNDTSPRNRDHLHPKVVPEFTKTFNKGAKPEASE